ncbi:MAG: WXG100 family type VII secretion target [Actinophytocola sp.]|uniref:WXG100 family type VII secretion target n=1 Tax=Actinophytocola sp. TaxID=1872138 RepID=UPI003D6ACEA1
MTSPFMDEVYEAAVDLVRNAIEQLKEIWNDFVEAFNKALKVVPGYLNPGLVHAMKKLSSWFGDMMEKVWKVYTERGSAGAVRAVAGDWNTEVGGKASTQAGLLVLGQLPTTGFWSGTAGSRYIHVVNGQNKALADVKTITDNLQTTLNEIAEAMRTFWRTLAVSVGGYVALMAGCAASAMFGVTAVVAIPAAVGFTVAFIGVLNDLTLDFSNALDAKEAKLRQLITTDSSFASGAWPPSTADALAEAAATGP